MVSQLYYSLGFEIYKAPVRSGAFIGEYQAVWCPAMRKLKIYKRRGHPNKELDYLLNDNLIIQFYKLFSQNIWEIKKVR